MPDEKTSPIFPRVICLTLPEERQRQLQVVQEFEKVGIRNYEFFPGYSKDSEEVRSAYVQGRVKRYPDCFRCGKRDCGNPDCNNILLPVQVAVALGFQSILKMVSRAREPYAAICEDDIVFAGYADKLLGSDAFQELIQACGLLREEPALLRLTRPGIESDAFFSRDIPADETLTVNSNPSMSNPFFLVNRAFARLACQRLNRIDHTADVIIHHDVAALGQSFTLNPQIIADRSWGVGDLPSLIHPKTHHLAYLRERHGESSPQALQEAERLQSHIKKAVCRPYCFTGSPRCGSHYVSAFLRKNGLEVGHESLGRDGICAWQFAVSSDRYPYVADPGAQSDFFVHADEWFVYTRDPLTAIPSLIIENQKAPLSYAFRREAILKRSGVNLDDFASPVEKAARAYAHWYLLALERKPKAVLRVEHLLDDCRRHIAGQAFEAVKISAEEGGAGKPYLGIVHSPVSLAADWMEACSKQTLAVLKDVADRLGYAVAQT